MVLKLSCWQFGIVAPEAVQPDRREKDRKGSRVMDDWSVLLGSLQELEVKVNLGWLVTSAKQVNGSVMSPPMPEVSYKPAITELILLLTGLFVEKLSYYTNAIDNWVTCRETSVLHGQSS